MLITKGIFLTLVLLSFTQLGFHFWPDHSYIYGIRSDYLAPVIYLSDVLILVLIFTSFSELKKSFILIRKQKVFLAVLLTVLIISSLLAENKAASFYKIYKVSEFTALGLVLYQNRKTFFDNSFSISLSLAVLFSSLIGIWQFFLQHSVGGILWWLGERSYNFATVGISTINYLDTEMLRAYSTFSHPNSFAGFVLVSLLLLYPWESKIKKVTLFLGIIGVIMAFSQVVFMTSLLVIFGFFVKKLSRLEILANLYYFFAIVLFTFSPVFLSNYLNTSEITERRDFLFVAFEMIKQNFLFGVGLNNFIVNTPGFFQTHTSWLLQPPHNIFMLILAEIGLIGFSAVVWLLYLCFKYKVHNFALWAILLTGSLDHYWLTLQQNELLATITFVYVLKKT